jgi:LmbE family N-acetylglucosaminyl deacetylase
MKRLLAIFAHPDDEGAIAGALARYAGEGVQVSLVCATKGESGEISDPSLATPENLGAVREAELRCACDVIGISDLYLLGYCDSGMDGTTDNEKTTAFIQAEPADVNRKLVTIMRQVRPHAVITFEPFGWYGHPDHIAAGRYTTEAYYLAADPQAYPEAGPPWQPLRLYHSIFRRSGFKMLADYVRAQGGDDSIFDDFPFDEPNPLEDQITHILDVGDFMQVKVASSDCHKTQFGEDHIFRNLPPDIMREYMGKEYFIQVIPSREPGGRTADDLLDGIFVDK